MLRPVSRTLVAVLSLGIIAACASSRSVVTGSPDPQGSATSGSSGAYVVTLGSDTIAVERFTRTSNRLTGDLMQRTPATLVSHYDVTLGNDGRPVRMDFATRLPNGNVAPGRASSAAMLFRGDTIVTQLQRDTLVTTKTGKMSGAWPYVPNSYAMYELPLAWMRASGRDSADLAFEPIGAAQAFPFPVKLVSADSARGWFFGYLQHFAVDANGRVMGVDATPSTIKVLVRRVSSVDFTGLLNHFAALDAAGKGLGSSASPRDTVTATIGGADLWVDYGRPATRGRDVWAGNSVLGDTLWRTGANAATQFRTSRDLMIGGQTLPAGMYTLWTHVMPNDRYELVINRQVGQWGTEHNAAQDLIRVPLAVTRLPNAIDRFTIGVVPNGNGGAIALTWGDRTLAVPFTVK